ncbi:inositol monophosphatase family protein, partial [Streptococcus pneumoniae]
MENKFVFAKEIVKEAGDYILAHMQEELHIERKSSPTDLVTRLDKEVQNFLVDRIRSHYPDDQFCAE